MLPGRVGLGRSLPLGGGVAIALGRISPEPVAEEPVPDRLGAVQPEHMEIAAWILRPQKPMALPPGLADRQLEPGPLQRRDVVTSMPVTGPLPGTHGSAPGGGGESSNDTISALLGTKATYYALIGRNDGLVNRSDRPDASGHRASPLLVPVTGGAGDGGGNCS
jgi:hypothetical protein